MKYDSIVIGGGPAGLSAALNLARRNHTALVLSAGESLLAKAELVDNYLGMQGMTGREMLDAFTAHAKSSGVEIRKAKAANIMPFDGSFMVNADGDILEARSIILAAGAAKAAPIAGESEFLGNGVSYCATCDGMLYRARTVCVWGLAEDAPHEANYLAGLGCSVQYVAPKQPQGLADGIVFVQGSLVSIAAKDTAKVVTLKSGDTLTCDCVFILRAAVPLGALLPELAVESGSVVHDTAGATNVAGVYVAGDMAGKPLQVAKAVGDGLIAALSCAEYLDKLQNS